jgi:hypothetical protein
MEAQQASADTYTLTSDLPLTNDKYDIRQQDETIIIFCNKAINTDQDLLQVEQ